MTTDLFVQRVIEVDRRDVSCRFFKPEEDRGDFFCPFEVGWPEGVKTRKVYDGDQVQALLLAMQSVHSDFLTLRDHGGRNVSGLGQRRLGLPVAEVVHDLDVDCGSQGYSQNG